MLNDMEPHSIISRGFVGAGSGVAALAINLSQANEWVKLISGIGSIIVIGLTIASLIRGWNKKP